MSRSRRGRRLHERTVNAIRDGYDEEMFALMDAALTRQYEAGLSAALIGGERAVEAAVSAAVMEAPYETLYQTVGLDFAARTHAAIMKSRKARAETQEDRWLDVVMTWLRTQGARRVRDVTEETVRRLRSALSMGVREGLGIEDVVRQIRRRLPTMTAFRARRIARTEIVGASNLGSLSAAMTVDFPLSKVWIAALDDRTRIGHRDVHNQAVGQDDAFEVQNDKGVIEHLLYPGDTSQGASASNIVNCRCAIAFDAG